MSVKAMMATILRNQLALRGVHSLTLSDCEEIVEQLVEQLRELELGLAAPRVSRQAKASYRLTPQKCLVGEHVVGLAHHEGADGSPECCSL